MVQSLTDPLGRPLSMTSPARRIVSLVPSQTELLADLGLEDEVIGITKFCVHPARWRKKKQVVGGTKQLHLDRVRALQPDLILANKEENTREEILELAEEFPLWMSEVATLPDALHMINAIGALTGKATEASALAGKIDRAFQELPVFAPKDCLYFIWRKPWMSIGGDTFIQTMLGYAGFRNLLADKKRYPELSEAEMQKLNPEVVLLSSEPYPFQEKHIQEIRQLLPKAEVKLVDGELFSWYGSRLLKSPAYFRQIRSQLP